MPWDRPIRDSIRELENSALETIKGTMRVAAREVVTLTPVDTGRLRGNWQPAINADPPEFRVQDDPSGAFTISLIFAVIDNVQLGDSLNISNATPYGIFINDGTSRIPPVMMVERAVAAASNFAARQGA